MDKKAFGERLANLRIARGIKSSAAMTRQGIKGLNEGDTQKYWGYEQGKSIPSYDVLVELCRFFGVSSDYLLGLDDEPIPGAKSIAEATGLTETSIAALNRLKKARNDETIDLVNRSLDSIYFYYALKDVADAKKVNTKLNIPVQEEDVFRKGMLRLGMKSTKSVIVDGKFARDSLIHRATEFMRSLFEEIVKSTAQEEGK